MNGSAGRPVHSLVLLIAGALEDCWVEGVKRFRPRWGETSTSAALGDLRNSRLLELSAAYKKKWSIYLPIKSLHHNVHI